MVQVSSGMAVVLVEYYCNARSKAHIAELRPQDTIFLVLQRLK